MKGRYQNPDDGKFNRPDPMRDWDWTSPHTLNLYQYGRNEPINGYDPNGFGWWSKGKAIYKLGKVAWKKGGVPSKADFAMTFKDTVEAFHIVSNPEVPFLTRFGTAFGATADWLAPVGGSEVKSAKKILSGGGKAKDTAKATATGVGAVQESKKIEKVVVVDGTKSPESAKHIIEAQAKGQPDVLTVDRPNAPTNRKESLDGVETKAGMDRDEYPPAVFKEGGSGASVKHVTSGDNRSAGAQIGNQLRGVKDGEKVKIVVDPPPPKR
jgi:hypothetical protein